MCPSIQPPHTYVDSYNNTSTDGTQKTDFPQREGCIREEGMGNSIVDSMESAHKFNAVVGLSRI